MSARSVAAATVWGASWLLAFASLAIAWGAGLPEAPLPGVFLSAAPAAIHAGFDTIGVTVALLYGPVSALILARRPHPAGIILAVHAVGSGLAAFGVQYGLLGERVPGLPGWGLAAFAAGWGFVPGTFLTASLPLLVGPHRLGRIEAMLVGANLVVAAAAFFLSLTQQSVPVPVNPLAIPVPGYQAMLPELYALLSSLAVAIAVASSGMLVLRWRRARGRARTGLAWLTLGHLFLSGSYLVLVLPEGLDAPGWLFAAGLVAPVLGQVLYPAAILVAVLGQRLWGVELIVSRLVLWALLTLAGIAVYLVVVLLVPLLLPGTEGVWLVAPIAVALAAQPMRRWLQRRIDLLVYGAGAQPRALLRRLSERIGALEPGPAGLRELAESLRQVLRLGSVEVRSTTTPLFAVSSSGHSVAAAAPTAGARRGTEHVVPLRAGSETAGVLVVQAPEGQRLDRRTIAVVTDVAGLVAAALRLAEANLVLERARAQLIDERAQERRAIRSELHDGLGPALAGTGFGLAAVENLLPARPQQAAGLLLELADELHRRAREVRQLADEVQPSPLEGGSLDAALAALARRFDSPALQVRLRGERAGALPSAVQDALYLIAAEAIANAARHARAGSIEARIIRHGEQVELLVTDDGIGLPAVPRPGVGLASMRERAESLGGSLTVAGCADGTIVRALLPARSPGGNEDIAY